MGLVDPPKFVSIPPVLIYGAEDLEREHYKALLQLFGWLWVTKRHGRDLTTTTTELMERWGVAERTVYHRLQRFGELGYLAVRVDGGRCYIRPGPRVAGSEFRASSLHEGEEVGASSLHYSISSVVGGISDPGDQDQELPTTTIDGELVKLLRLRGVHPGRVERLARDPWVTADRVEAWWVDLVRQEREEPGRIRSKSAVLAANLEAHYDPPGLRLCEGYGRG